MKRRAKVLIALVIVIVAGGAYHLVSLDGVHGQLLSILMGHDTRYAPQYSDARFREIEVGMREEDVLKLLGPPLEVVGRASETGSNWYYSESPAGGHFRARVVVVSDGRVTGRFAEFYVD